MRIKIKQIPDQSAINLGLDKYDRSKFPGAIHAVMPGYGPDGRFITGIDEEALSVTRIPDTKNREQKRKELKLKRERLEKSLGHSLNAAPTNKFWENYLVDITGLANTEIDEANPQHELSLAVILANGDIAPDYAAANSPQFARCKFYLHREEDEVKQTVSKSKLINKAAVALEKAAEEPKRLDLLARYVLGPKKITMDMSSDSKYQLLDMFIRSTDKNKSRSNAQEFIDASALGNADMYTRIIVEEAIQKQVIRFTSGYYQRGNATYGRTLEEMMEYFTLGENVAELAGIKVQLEKEYAFRL